MSIVPEIAVQAPATPNPVAARRSRLPAWLPHALAFALIAGQVAGLATFSALHDKQRHRDSVSVATRNMSRLLDENISSSFDKIDIVLHEVVAHCREEAEMGRFDPGSLDTYLVHREALIPQVSALRMSNKEGFVSYGRKATSDPIDISDRDFFIQLRDDPKAGLVVAGPLLTRADKQWVIVLARRISAADGSFAGVVYARFPTGQFDPMLSPLALGASGAATLRATDLALVDRNPHNADAVGSRNVSAQLRAIVEAHSDAGEYVAVTALDGIERSNAYRKLARYPFYVIVGLGTDEYVGRWQNNAATLAALAALAILLTGLTSFLFYRNAQQHAADLLDRTAREARLRDAQRETLALQRLAHAGSWSWDLERNTQQWSDEIYTLCGRQPELGPANYAEVRNYFSGESWQRLGGAVAKCSAEGLPYSCDAEVVRADGSRRWAVVFGEAVRNDAGAIVKLRGTIQDISERKLAEAELDQHRHHLETLVEHRTAALSIAKDAAEAASRAKTAFLANVSHELRTPLNGMMGMTAVALRGMSDPVRIAQLGKAMLSAERLLVIINNLLDVAWIESERFRLSPADFVLADVIDKLNRLIGPAASKNGLALVIDIAADLSARPLHGDAMHLGQLLGHLLDNAVKFTDSGRVELRVLVAEESASDLLLRFEVRDTGIGIASEHQQRLFSAFERADNSLTRKHGGTGLGLAICKRLAQAMGGAIGLESELGAGSLFWFSARLAKGTTAVALPPAEGFASAEHELQTRYRGALILLAEDDAINREATTLLIEEAGLRVDTAGNGAQAVDLARATAYDAIIMDLRMPVLNGVEAARMIRALPGRARTPILALTASLFTKDSERCYAAGMNDFIAKPVNPEVFFATLLRWLKRRD